MTKSTGQLRGEIKNLFIAAFICAVGALLVFFSCLAMGKCYLRGNSVITEIGICLDSSTYRPVTEVPIGTEQFYLCGEIEGSTPLPGALYLFRSDKEFSVYSADFEESPGIFFYELTGEKDLEPGHYRVQIWSAKETMANIEFVID